MRRGDRHISKHVLDEEMLAAADGELAAQRAVEVRAHLEACWSCRARMTEMNGAVSEFVRGHRQNLDRRLPSADGPRALLRARMAEMAQKPARRGWRWKPRFTLAARAVALGAGVLAAGVAGVMISEHEGGSKTAARTAAAEPGALPERGLTPGATRAVTISEVCSIAHEEVVRAVPASTRSAVFAEYGLKDARPDDYEIDYLIAPGLGGTEDIHNLWPQPFRSATWNARVKDALEERLHAMVCAGDLDLPTAQREIATDWIAAYKKYFHTNAPTGEISRVELNLSPIVPLRECLLSTRQSLGG